MDGHAVRRDSEQRPRGGGHGHADFESDRLVAFLEAEGEAASGLTQEVIALCAEQLEKAAQPVERIIDLGSGPGVGTTSLCEAFPSATVVAVDGSSGMLERTRARAHRLGRGDQIETLRLDLDGALSALGSCDLVWAAMAIHHVTDEAATLTEIKSVLRPGGLLCVLERAEPTDTRLEHDLGRPGIWERLEAARREWLESVRARMPGAANANAYPSMLAVAGFEIIAEQTLVDVVDNRGNDGMREFIQRQLVQTAKDLADFADGSDLEALEIAAAKPPEGATIALSRKIFIARPATR